MPFFKTWNVSRTTKKSVMANTVEELVRKGREKLGLKNPEESRVFDEEDGTEIDDDECLLTYEKGSVFIIGKDWQSHVDLIQSLDVQQGVKGTKTISVEKCKSFEEVVGFGGAGAKEDAGSYSVSVDSGDDVEFGEVEDDLFGMSGSIEVEEGVSDLGESSYAGELLSDVQEVIGEPSEVGDVLNDGNEGVDEVHIEKVERKRSLIEEPSVETTAKKRVYDVDVSKKGKLIGLSKKDDSLSAGSSKMSVTEVLMKGGKYKNAIIKNIKIYSEAEISSTNLEMEKKRRRFWNEKAEQLAASSKTAQLDKTTMTGIIDVAWTLRKTSFIEDDARKTMNDEKVLFPTKDSETMKKGSQKKETIPKNIERMAVAHNAVEKIDNEILQCRDQYKKENSIKRREVLIKEYKKKKLTLDGVYTELKRAQDAAIKSIKHKRKILDDLLKSKSTDLEMSSISTDD